MMFVKNMNDFATADHFPFGLCACAYVKIIHLFTTVGSKVPWSLCLWLYALPTQKILPYLVFVITESVCLPNYCQALCALLTSKNPVQIINGFKNVILYNGG